MPRTPFLQRVCAAVLVAALLLPAAAVARGPHPIPPTESILAALWHFVSSLVSGDTTDNQGTIDPDGLQRTGAAGENGSQIDPDGARLNSTDNRGTIDPDGLTDTAGSSGENRSQIDPNG
ncbi:MAG TPA: hypothetical protein VFC23_06750 [Thermoanaerobaculia bacterium]|nr:hypothetical protein [Thermoanaerobaculia bacterium]